MYYKIRFQRDFFKLVANDCSDKRLLLTSEFCPLGGCLPLTCGYIYLLNREKMCIKSEVEEIFFKLATNDQSDVRPSQGLRYWSPLSPDLKKT